MTEDEFDELMKELGIPEENIIRTNGGSKMKTYFITFDGEAERFDGEEYDSLSGAKEEAIGILNRIHQEKSNEALDDDIICGYTDDNDGLVDHLVIVEAISASLPDMGEMVADQLDDWAISEGEEDYLEPMLNKDVDELNTMITSWLLKKGYKPNWYNVLNTFTVERGDSNES